MYKNAKENNVIIKILNIIFRYIFSVLAAVILLYLIGTFIYGLSDIGIILAAVLCVGYILLVGRPKFITKIISKLSVNKAGKNVVIIVYVLLGLSIIYAVVTSGLMINSANKKPSDVNTTLIVLGCKVDGTLPSKSLYRRLLAAETYLKENPSVKCVVSGGKGHNEGISEALCMYNYLTQNGISENRIFMEDKSTNTDENIRYSMQIIEKNNLNSKVTIVTDGYHQFRASIIAKRNSVNLSGAVSANTPIEVLITYWVREWVAIPVEMLK